MSASIIPAMQRLIAILEAENSALEEARILDALAFLGDKKDAARTLEHEVAAANDRKEELCPCCPDDENVAGADAPALPYRDLLEQMTELGNRNGELLQRAITAQKRVIELLTSTPTTALPQNYGNQGSYAPVTDRQALFTSKA
ncbi:flagellar protein FlgN [Gluconobacter sp. LMG 31484]|uniref:Flagellar protein FlgN n=1 Tax=Gluconobacter vitians TaxID=2728102 RepID=A0ABR9Y5U1_9PROT|nr:flagellar protein FlgN [Gluconobacter vitians]MBF0858988.1 flagellar protein FlgN [Gluconobacter vitians]